MAQLEGKFREYASFKHQQTQEEVRPMNLKQAKSRKNCNSLDKIHESQNIPQSRSLRGSFSIESFIPNQCNNLYSTLDMEQLKAKNDQINPNQSGSKYMNTFSPSMIINSEHFNYPLSTTHNSNQGVSSSAFNEMKNINLKIKSIFKVQPPYNTLLSNQIKLTLPNPQKINHHNTITQISNMKKQKNNFPIVLPSLKVNNPIIEEAINMQQEKKRTRSKNTRNTSQCSIQDSGRKQAKNEQISPQKENLQENISTASIDIQQTPCFKQENGQFKTLDKQSALGKNAELNFQALYDQMKDERSKSQIMNLVDAQKKRQSDQSNLQSRVLSTACTTENNSSMKEQVQQRFKPPKVLSKHMMVRPESCLQLLQTIKHPGSALSLEENNNFNQSGKKGSSNQSQSNQKQSSQLEFKIQKADTLQEGKNHEASSENEFQYSTLTEFFNAKQIEEEQQEKKEAKKKVATRNLHKGFKSYDQSMQEELEMIKQNIDKIKQGIDKPQVYKRKARNGSEKSKVFQSADSKRNSPESIKQESQSQFSSQKRSSTQKNIEPYQNQSIDFNKKYQFNIDNSSDSQDLRLLNNVNMFKPQSVRLPLINLQSPKNSINLNFNKPSKLISGLPSVILSREVSPERLKLPDEQRYYQGDNGSQLSQQRGHRQYLDKVKSSKSVVATAGSNNTQQSVLSAFSNQTADSNKGGQTSQRGKAQQQAPPSMMMHHQITRRPSVINCNAIIQGNNNNDDQKLLKNAQDVVNYNITFGVFKGSETQKNMGQTSKFGGGGELMQSLIKTYQKMKDL